MKIVELDEPIWIIGDVHGEYEKLISLLNKLPKNSKVCFVGDLIDRGLKSKEVIRIIRERNYFCVLGNHEEMMINSLLSYNSGDFSNWMRNGGVNTIKSYLNISKEEDFKYYKYPQYEFSENIEIRSDIKWLNTLPIIIKFKINKEKPLYVSHSGISLFKDDKEIIENNSSYSILWNRNKKTEVDFAINIHGHTPRTKDLIRISSSQIDIDTGACFNKDNFGYLTAIEYPSLKLIHSE